MGGLRVYVDGTPMPEADARALWQRFSGWMESHRGDLAGFAKAEGFASVHPGVEDGGPVLHVSRSAAQKPYAPVREAGGSAGRHGPPPGGSKHRAKDRKSRGKPRP
jgi:hypothetical protein